MRKMRGRLMALAFALAGLAGFTGCPTLLPVQSIDFAGLPDGTFAGYAHNRIIRVRVAVTVADGAVTDIAILEHRQGRGRQAEVIAADVIRAQSLEVDAIASATFSSSTILKAIENALLLQAEE